MASVWVVERGEYSDRKILAVFSGVEAANAFVGEGGDEYDVTEYPLDKCPEGRVQRVYSVAAFISDGESKPLLDRIEIVPPNWSQTCLKTYWRWYGWIEEWRSGQEYALGESVVSAEHAAKISAEKRQQVLRERAQAPVTPVMP